MDDPLSIIINNIYKELEMDDDTLDGYYKLLGHSQGEIDSYKQTRKYLNISKKNK